jgi:hypothetical protein
MQRGIELNWVNPSPGARKLKGFVSLHKPSLNLQILRALGRYSEDGADNGQEYSKYEGFIWLFASQFLWINPKTTNYVKILRQLC